MKEPGLCQEYKDLLLEKCRYRKESLQIRLNEGSCGRTIILDYLGENPYQREAGRSE